MNENEISLEEAQLNGSLFGLSAQEWAAQEGWTIVEGKQNDSTETDPPANQNTETSVGESNSGDISLGSPVVNEGILYGKGAAYGNRSLSPIYL